MTFDLVEFACLKNDRVKYLALTEKQFDSYVNGEPQEGYFVFKYLGEITLTDEVITQVVNQHELSEKS